MRLLIDTHAYLWWLADEPRLGSAAREAIADPASLVYVSSATIWEIAIKSSLGKLDVEGDPVQEISANGFSDLPISVEHAHCAGNLPRHHEDPFDRILIAQAQLESLVLISHDPAFTAYEVALLPT